MKRRDFVALLGGAAVWPLAAHAHESGKIPRIGVLNSPDRNLSAVLGSCLLRPRNGGGEDIEPIPFRRGVANG
jgi:hypothetical protein